MSRPEPLQPAFDFPPGPDPVPLFKGQVEVTRKGRTLVGEGTVLLRFAPDARVAINVKLPADLDICMSWSFCDSAEFDLQLNGRKIDGFRGKFEADASGLDLDWHPRSLPMEVGDRHTKQLTCVVGHVFNFPDFRGPQHPLENVPLGCSLLLLDADGWRCMLQALPNQGTRSVWERISEEGLCLLTHMVKLQRKDGATFSVEAAKRQLTQLTQFLSFVKGSSNWVVCDVGFDADGARAWQSFCAPRLGESWYSWADASQGQTLETLFPLFVARWNQSAEWRECLSHAIYWYTQANTGGGQPGIDSALILVQAALERLAHHHAVVDQKLISAVGFKKLAASDKLRLLFSSLHLPLDIPSSTPAIEDAANRYNWLDAPHAITLVRNSLVHPESKVQVSDCYFDAWKLSLWYLELAMLAMCGYEGSYRSRLEMGRTENVPWMKAGRCHD